MALALGPVFTAMADGNRQPLQAIPFNSNVYNSVPKISQQKSPLDQANAFYEKVCADDQSDGSSLFTKCGQLGIGLTGFHNHGSVKDDELVLEKFSSHPETNAAALITEAIKKESLQTNNYSASVWIIIDGELQQFELSEDAAVVHKTHEMEETIVALTEFIKKYNYTDSLAPMILTRNSLPLDPQTQVHFEETLQRESDGGFRNVLTVQPANSADLQNAVVTRVAFDIDNLGKPTPYGFCLSTKRHSGENK